MRIRIPKLTAAAILLAILLQFFVVGAFAQETDGQPAETNAPTEASGYQIDSKTAVFQICDELAQNMEARQILVYDTTSDRILYTKTVEGGKLFPASITKLFSTYVALQYLDPDTVVTAGDELDLVHAGSSVAYVGKGHQLPVKMLVEGMMLPSGNDAAMVLAAAAGRVIADDATLPAADAVQEFVDEMNRQADALGFEKTHFSNPDGWHTGSHYTCVSDLARIAGLALGNETIRSYMGLHEDDTHFDSGQHIIWENTNLLLDPDGTYYRDDAVGMKTGYTRPAGYCLMSAFTFDEGEIVVGLFGYTSKYARFDDAVTLVDAVKHRLRLEQLSGESVG